MLRVAGRRTARRTLRGLLAVIPAMICAAEGSDGKDWLSGEYRFVVPKEELKSFSEELAEEGLAEIPAIGVMPMDEGWVLRQGDDEVLLEPGEKEKTFYADFFPGNEDDEEMQCGVATRIIFCHVTPETLVGAEGDRFLANTGYFAIILHHGAVELERTP